MEQFTNPARTSILEAPPTRHESGGGAGAPAPAAEAEAAAAAQGLARRHTTSFPMAAPPSPSPSPIDDPAIFNQESGTSSHNSAVSSPKSAVSSLEFAESAASSIESFLSFQESPEGCGFDSQQAPSEPPPGSCDCAHSMLIAPPGLLKHGEAQDDDEFCQDDGLAQDRGLCSVLLEEGTKACLEPNEQEASITVPSSSIYDELPPPEDLPIEAPPPLSVPTIDAPAVLEPTSMMSSFTTGVPKDSHADMPDSIDVEAVPDRDQLEHLDSTSASAATSKPILTDELKAKIVKQVELYFSDANLPTDNYLMKFVRKDPEGFVPIPVVANFRKVRNLLKNHALVATALRSSKQLVISDDGKKVRRLRPLPDVDLEELQSRTVVAENLPEDHSIDAMKGLFGRVGNVKMVRICQPEAGNGANHTAAKFIKTDMVVSNKLHALIEYESVEQAERAVSELSDHRNWRSGLHVRLLLRRTFHGKHGHQQPTSTRVRKSGDGGDWSGGEEDAVPSLGDAISEKITEESHHGVERSDELGGYENIYSEKDGRSKRGRGRGRGRTRGRGQFHPNGGRGHPVGTPPHANSFISTETKPPPGPRMPDGTRGFNIGRGKVLSSNSA